MPALQPLRFDHLQAGLHLWRPRHRPDRTQPRLRHVLGPRRLAADAVPDEDRAGRSREAAPARGREIKTTFASHYTHTISLAEALSAGAIAGYNKRATGEKYSSIEQGRLVRLMTIKLYHCKGARSVRPLWTLEEMGIPLRTGVDAVSAARCSAKAISTSIRSAPCPP